jgi:hypothetical protein
MKITNAGQDPDHRQDPLTREQSAKNRQKIKTDEMERAVATPHPDIAPGAARPAPVALCEWEASRRAGGGA